MKFSTGPIHRCAVLRFRGAHPLTSKSEMFVSGLLKFALGIDWVSDKFGRIAAFAVMAAAMISAGNAFVRYGLDISSNGWLEIQWYLFAITVMLGGPIVLKLRRFDSLACHVDAAFGLWLDVPARLERNHQAGGLPPGQLPNGHPL